VSPPTPARTLVGALLVGALVAGAAGYLSYARDIARIRSVLDADGRLVETVHGTVEYATWGQGPPVVVLHGAGGGYDQGRLIAERFGGDGFRWIAVSRFGYLRSTLPDDASTAAQADAVAELLDALGLAQVAVLAMSGGVPPALQFAARHPQRTTALVLLSSAPWTPLTAASQDLPIPAWLYQALFGSDLPYWLITKLYPAAVGPIFDVDADRRARLSDEERQFVSALVRSFLPVTRRTAGLANEGAAIDPAARYDAAGIGAPALVVHARDDQINPFAIGQYTARALPGARLLALEHGGHLLLGHHAEVRRRTAAFLRGPHARLPEPPPDGRTALRPGG
jgi:pimeloyl-ACP methyl ester carboxylesterase